MGQDSWCSHFFPTCFQWNNVVELCASFCETAAWLPGVSVTCRGWDNSPKSDMNSPQHSSIESFAKAFGQKCNILQPRFVQPRLSKTKMQGLWPMLCKSIHHEAFKHRKSKETKALTVNWPVVACILPMMTWPLSSFTTAACPRLRAAHVS